MPPALHTRSLWRPKCREAKNELLLCRCRRLGFAHEALDHFARAPQRGPQVEVAGVPLALLEIRPQSLVALKTGMGGRGAVGQQSAPGSCLDYIDAGRQEEHRDEEHGQVHCADTVSARGQGDGAYSRVPVEQLRFGVCGVCTQWKERSEAEVVANQFERVRCGERPRKTPQGEERCA